MICWLALTLNQGFAASNDTAVSSNDTSSDDSVSLNQSFPVPDVRVDASRCVKPPATQYRSPWKYEGPASSHFPPPSVNELVDMTDLSAMNTSIPAKSVQTTKRGMSLSPRENEAVSVENLGDEHFQERTFRFQQEPTSRGGNFKLSPQPMIDLARHYWLVWETRGPIILTAWLKNRRTKLWEKQTLEQDTGSTLGCADWQGLDKYEAIRVDISISPQGGSGEVSLFSVTSPG